MRAKLWNNDWEYWETENDFALKGEPQDTKKIELPHDAMLERKAHSESPNAWTTGYRDGGIYNYRKYFNVAENWKKKTNIVKFEGVYMNARVFVNGEFAGKCHYGYNTFFINLDPYLKFGSQNEIRVVVNNRGSRNSRWYSGGGIYRDVYLLQGGMSYIKAQSLKIHTIDVEEDAALLKLQLEIEHRIPETKDAAITIQIRDIENKLVAEDKTKVLLYEDKETKIVKTILVRNPKLWSAETPTLYQVSAMLDIDGNMQDVVVDDFGIRMMTLDTERGLRINKKPVKLKGSCIHHDSGILGAASYEEAHIRQMTLLKEAGFNAIRMSHHPMGDAMLRACDKVGMYVMDETFDMWNISKNDFDSSEFFENDWKFTIKRMVDKDYNHPSVVMYSLGNEIPECGENHGIELGTEMAEYLKEYDSTRYVTEAVNGIFAAGNHIGDILKDVLNDKSVESKAEEINDFMAKVQGNLNDIMKHEYIGDRLDRAFQGMDLAGYNYMASRYQLDKELYPNRPIVATETYPPKIVEEWDVIERSDNVIGEFTWTGWDYIGETGIGIVRYGNPEGQKEENQYPNQLAYVGDRDITGVRRPMSYLRQIIFEKNLVPYIAVQNPEFYGMNQLKSPWVLSDACECWNWKGYEKKPIIVEVYSAAEEVELFVNGISKSKKAVENYRTLFDTIYDFGEVTAVAYQSGKEVGSYTMKSASDKRRFYLEKEKNWGDKLLFFNLEVRDENGIIAADEYGKIRIKVEGAELIGFGSADYAPLDNYNTDVTRLYQGRAQIILKRIKDSKIVNIKVEGIYDPQNFKFEI